MPPEGLPPTNVWIVDAMNVIGSRPTGWWRDRPAAVRRLVDTTRRLVAVTREPVTLVVDGRPPPELPDGDEHGVRLVYALRAGPDAADDRIVELVAAHPAPASVRVVTSDRALQARVRELWSQVVTAHEWLRRLEAQTAP